MYFLWTKQVKSSSLAIGRLVDGRGVLIWEGILRLGNSDLEFLYTSAQRLFFGHHPVRLYEVGGLIHGLYNVRLSQPSSYKGHSTEWVMATCMG